MAATSDQNIALLSASTDQAAALQSTLKAQGIQTGDSPELRRFRVCPGNHECRMGLAPTREIAREITAAVPAELSEKSWAISGCRNSCSQPQLADVGIVTKSLQKDKAGNRHPRFDLYRRDDEALGHCIAEGLSAEALYAAIQAQD